MGREQVKRTKYSFIRQKSKRVCLGFRKLRLTGRISVNTHNRQEETQLRGKQWQINGKSVN